MSLDIFLQAFHDGDPQDVPTPHILKCVGEFAANTDTDFVDLVFGPRDSCTLYFDTREPVVQGLTVNRPCGDRRLAKVLFEIMQLGNFVLFIPGEEPPIVTDEAAIGHLPEDMVEALGEPMVAATLEEFTRAVFSDT